MMNKNQKPKSNSNTITNTSKTGKTEVQNSNSIGKSTKPSSTNKNDNKNSDIPNKTVQTNSKSDSKSNSNSNSTSTKNSSTSKNTQNTSNQQKNSNSNKIPTKDEKKVETNKKNNEINDGEVEIHQVRKITQTIDAKKKPQPKDESKAPNHSQLINEENEEKEERLADKIKNMRRGTDVTKQALLIPQNIVDEKKEPTSPNKKDSLEKAKGLITNMAYRSKAGCSVGKTPKINQDSYFVCPRFTNVANKYFFGVADGHGLNGHIVSGYIKENLPKFLEKYYNQFPNDIHKAFELAFSDTNRGILNSDTDCTLSGSTTVSVLLLGTKLYCGNVGDSRAILARKINGKWKSEGLSIDHKPDLPSETKRIKQYGGRVEQYREITGEVIGPSRVWLADEDLPGLAMSRSMGDTIAAKIGVISIPEVKDFEVKVDEEKFIVIASDGVWEFLSNDDVMNTVVPYYEKNDPEGACKKLVKLSRTWWKKEDEVIDDITALALYMKPLH